MAQIVLSQAGAVAGSALLPQGIGLLGQSVGGALIGQTVGSLAGLAIDRSLAAPIDGPRIDTFKIMESREGAGLPSVYGRARVGGQVIWGSRFLENRNRVSGGKGGPSYNEYTYTVSFAVALCEGPITRVDRIWANGEEIALADINWRLYTGTETQEADPLIEAIEGSDQAPAYRGTAYVVFEDLPLDTYGNRMPQLSFEVVRASQNDGALDLRSTVRGVNIIPATGEFVYASQVVRARRFPGIEQALNMNNGEGRADFMVSLDQLNADLPNVNHAALTVGWFGNDLRAGACTVRPGVETHDRNTVPYQWSVDGRSRNSSYLISKSPIGNANYGGTPADAAVFEGIAALQAAGIDVTYLPFLLMDVPQDNGLPDPYGGAQQAPFPWRGRITTTEDGTAQTRADIDAFVGVDGGFGYRHFILHNARLAQQAGGVETFLVGSEMVTLTRLRDDQGRFPFVEALIDIAGEARQILGPDVKISYAADWSEYGAFQAADGTGDVLFPLDPLWASDDIDFVGVDWYPPTGDWRDGDAHADAVAGFEAEDDPDYLVANFAGGEAYDWYYASEADRDAQNRTPISDNAHGEDWIFRAKDLANWWSQVHFERPGGIRSSAPTPWQPGSKPIRLIEIGFPAIDKGGNAPNLFYDPKSSESAFPPYSNGARDDLFQRRALISALSYWDAAPFVERAFVWAWDGRPWPYFPTREDIWSDGPNWQFGHWLNGRSGLIELAAVIEDIAARGGTDVDASGVSGFVEGYTLESPSNLRTAMAPLQTAFAFDVVEHETGLVFRHRANADQLIIEDGQTIEASLSHVRPLIEAPPTSVVLNYVSGAGSYEPAVVEARTAGGGAKTEVRVTLPMVLGEGRAQGIAEDLLSETRDRTGVSFSVGPQTLVAEPGDIVFVEDDGPFFIDAIEDDGLSRAISTRRMGEVSLPNRSVDAGDERPVRTIASLPEFVLLDVDLSLLLGARGLFAAVSASPWVGPVSIEIGGDISYLSPRGEAVSPAGIGRLQSELSSGPLGRWDRRAVIDIVLPDQQLSSKSVTAVLNGDNRLLVQGDEGAELIGFLDAELIGEETWRLTGLMRGLQGSQILAFETGAVAVLVDDRLPPIQMSDVEVSLDLLARAGRSDVRSLRFDNLADLAWRVGHLRVQARQDGSYLTWTARDRAFPTNWSAPEAQNSGAFLVELIHQDDTIEAVMTTQAELFLAESYTSANVCRIGADGRAGRRVSITLGAD
ncbi:MAG: glycoside hydrolase/phage tail family protein [Pseudomonadota bacterium]